MTWSWTKQRGWIFLDDPPARSSGQEPHDDPWQYAGRDADPPVEPDTYDSVVRTLGIPREAGRDWRNCHASIKLIDEINLKYPARDKSSDGTIGDAAHASRGSDHNPWVVMTEAGKKIGIVRARDIDRDGIDSAGLAEYLRTLGKDHDERLINGGYIIFNRRITTKDFSGWKVYNGTNPHTSHIHVSFSQKQAGYDSTKDWGIADEGDDDLTPEQERLLKEVHAKLHGKHPERVDYRFLGRNPPPHRAVDDIGGFAINADARAYEAREIALEALNRAKQGMGVDPAAIASAIMDQFGPVIREAIQEVLGRDDMTVADKIVDLIGQRLLEGE